MALRPAPSAQRAAEIVHFLATRPERSVPVAEIARSLDQSRATCAAVLLALEEHDWVRRDDGGGYALGTGLIAVGMAAQRGTAVVQLLRDAVGELHATTRYEATACILSAQALVIVARAGFNDPLATTMTLGQAFPFEPPHGLAMVAWGDEDLEHWLQRANGLSTLGETRLRRAAALVREAGFGVMLDSLTHDALGASLDTQPPDQRAKIERMIEQDELLYAGFEQRRNWQVSYVTAPVFTADGAVAALVGLLVRTNTPAEIPDLAELVRGTAADLTRALGERTGVGTHEARSS